MGDDGKREGGFLGLSERQRLAIGAAVTILASAIILAAILGVGWLLAAFLRRFSHVFLPLAVAGVLALVFRPYFAWLHAKLRLPRPLALVAVVVSILVPFVAFAWFFGAIAVDQVTDMATHFPEWWKKRMAEAKQNWPQVREFLENNPWGQRLRQAAESGQEALLGGLTAVGGGALSAGRGLLNAIGTLFAWAVLPVYFAFFLLGSTGRPADLDRWLPFLKPETRRDVSYLFDQFLNIVVAFFRGQLIVALLQGLLFAVGFSVVGLKYGFVLGLMLGLLNIIPYLGSILGLGIGLPLAYFQDGGGWVTLVSVIVVFTIVQLIEGYLLTPKIMGDRTGLHPVAIIVAVFFWGSALGGIFGMILAIPLTAFLVVFWRLAREKYIGEIV